MYTLRDRIPPFHSPRAVPTPSPPFASQVVATKDGGSTFYIVKELASVDDPKSKLSTPLIGVKVDTKSSLKLSFEGEVCEGAPGRHARAGAWEETS